MSPALIQLLTALIGGAAQVIEASKNKTVATIGQDIALADQIAANVLQTVGAVKGANIDWSDPAQVAAFVQSLPAFTPIQDPPPAAA